MAQESPGALKPFHVRTKAEGALHSGHDEESQAEFAAKEANEKAEALGVKARYEVVPKA